MRKTSALCLPVSCSPREMSKVDGRFRGCREVDLRRMPAGAKSKKPLHQFSTDPRFQSARTQLETWLKSVYFVWVLVLKMDSKYRVRYQGLFPCHRRNQLPWIGLGKRHPTGTPAGTGPAYLVRVE